MLVLMFWMLSLQEVPMSSAPPGMTDSKAVILARLLHGENRANMTPEEAIAMGDTALNRTELHGYPDQVEDVLLQNRNGRYQYAPMNPTNPNYPVISQFGPGHPEWDQYYEYAKQILDPARKRSSYTHYFSGKAPVWAKSLEGLTQIGSHWFGTEKRRRKRKKESK